ncbi:MAG: protein kinase, partial [Planctomycetota bacterium]
VTLATDIYSLGVILFELLVGQTPHRGDTLIEVFDKLRHETAPDPRTVSAGIDRDLSRIVNHCLEREPENRYPSAAALADDLDRWLGGRAISLKSPSWIDASRSWLKRNRQIAIVFVGLSASFLIVAPVALQLIASLDQPSSFYRGTPDDPVPWLFSGSSIPDWISQIARLLILFLWPSLGALVVLVGQPKSLMAAVRSGFLVSITCALMLAVVVGWIPFCVVSQSSSNDTVRQMAAATFSDDPQVIAKAREQLMSAYPVLGDSPENQRINIVANRVFGDGIAVGPQVLGFVIGGVFLFALPGVFGAAAMQWLRSRGQAWWWLWPRYFLSWGSFGFAVLLWIAIIGGELMGKPEFPSYHPVLRWILPTIPLSVSAALLLPWNRAFQRLFGKT